MQAGDTLVNNTDYELFVFDPDGREIACIEPGNVFEASRDRTIVLDANSQYTFRAYINSGYRRN